MIKSSKVIINVAKMIVFICLLIGLILCLTSCNESPSFEESLGITEPITTIKLEGLLDDEYSNEDFDIKVFSDTSITSIEYTLVNQWTAVDASEPIVGFIDKETVTQNIVDVFKNAVRSYISQGFWELTVEVIYNNDPTTKVTKSCTAYADSDGAEFVIDLTPKFIQGQTGDLVFTGVTFKSVAAEANKDYRIRYKLDDEANWNYWDTAVVNKGVATFSHSVNRTGIQTGYHKMTIQAVEVKTDKRDVASASLEESDVSIAAGYTRNFVVLYGENKVEGELIPAEYIGTTIKVEAGQTITCAVELTASSVNPLPTGNSVNSSNTTTYTYTATCKNGANTVNTGVTYKWYVNGESNSAAIVSGGNTKTCVVKFTEAKNYSITCVCIVGTSAASDSKYMTAK